MPNHCQNKAVFTYPKEGELTTLCERFRIGRASGEGVPNGPFTYLRPTPVDLLEGRGWYDWRVTNWGTKWDCMAEHDITLDLEEKALTVSFDTAWSPPIKLYEYLHTHTEWRVNAMYFEAGTRFYGWFSEGGAETYTDNDGPLTNLVTAGFRNTV
jgi:hypothetical protein